jgi:tRNA dimethylallyltransferase
MLETLSSIQRTPSLIFLAGPTAVGKSPVALELARQAGGEIISLDAMQIYREITIASDKPSAAMRRDVRHHMIDVISVEEPFSAAHYRRLALAAIGDVCSRGKVPVVAGGSGMYMMSLLDGIFEYGEIPSGIRERLEAEPAAALYERLCQADPEAASRISPNDKRRVVRALEVFEATGERISGLQKKRDGLWGKAPVRIFGLSRRRDELYRRAEDRIDAMFGRGLVDEVRAVLLKKMTPSALGLIGIPEVRGFLDGDYGLERAAYLMKRNTRHYIKRQMTWFNKDGRIEWIGLGPGDSPAGIAAGILKRVREASV